MSRNETSVSHQNYGPPEIGSLLGICVATLTARGSTCASIETDLGELYDSLAGSLPGDAEPGYHPLSERTLETQRRKWVASVRRETPKGRKAAIKYFSDCLSYVLEGMARPNQRSHHESDGSRIMRGVGDVDDPLAAMVGLCVSSYIAYGVSRRRLLDLVRTIHDGQRKLATLEPKRD